jgi:UDP-N-acetyl-D-mannosaminuronate dehydrogenase
MNTEELTSMVTAHQNAISRHDQEMAEIRAIFQQSAIRHRDQEERLNRIETILEATAAQQRQNAQGITELRASITELRNVVANYIQGRSQIE